MRLNIEVNHDIDLKFPFEKFIIRMIDIVPKEDIIGLDKIIIKKEALKKYQKQNDTALSFYVHDKEKNTNQIEVFINNILNKTIPEYAFKFYPEIGGLLLSEIIYHEIGHHVHFYKRHGIKKKKYEKFAEKYSKAGYFNYLKSRKKKILRSFTWAMRNFLLWSKKDREMFKLSKQELIDWLEDNMDGIKYP